MAAVGLLLALLLFLFPPSAKAVLENENSTLEADDDVPMNETSLSETREVQNAESPAARAGLLSVCPCDLHPGFCDLNCCCDSSCGSECDRGSPECPFSFCLPGSTRAVSHVCVEKSLIFRNNTPYRTEVLPGPGGCLSLFCVQLNDSRLNYFQKPQVVTEENFPALAAEYGGPSFISAEQVQPSPSVFYQVGDPIQIYFAATSVLSVLKQPVGMGASQLCIDENPAGFLESKSTSCIRILTNLMNSCTTDPALDAASYYRHFSVLKVPVNMTIFQPVQVNIIPLSEPASPSLNGSTCHNVVSEVIYEVEFNGIHGIQKVSVQFKVASVFGNPAATLQQRFSLHFGSRSPSFTKRRSGNPGYIVGAPLIAMYNGTQQHVTILQNQGNGQCSATERHKVQFGKNMIAGCQFRLQETNCTHLQELLYEAFQGGHSLGSLAITGNADPGHPGEWNGIFTQRCNIQGGHCMVPISLEIQVLWAQVGLLSNPQAQVLGARYYYLCKPLKSLDIYMNMLSLTTAASFTDVTKWPEPPRDQPRVHWKLPFDFFFPFKMALSGAVSSSGSLAGTLLVFLMLFELLIS
ncbi:tectonic-3 isoform X2 [Elgaria multicarinata webbii]|uniref:tectonic-3 isoform X2 n=1 Tax=Elgaria multicarinata webbii TaxID=159646 RepID=UPI002FCD6492